ncbi:N-acetylglucosamine-6-phosphate deacetylase [Rhodosalinus halophilus]|uniref:N-acetylglucosamine-6-phosphate deacetylase n=1 Tax=Rhodosalinus halophilus TaxID=2259333 RepID=A0A365U4E7_9RHOB|nr:N-acetylglucosamine-6-phosphate deacetylase [Rhodosalinus halophilus]RBI82875.1 N-acetylglucosamine-6-phosphate deacetylase [Rhodosalinus halophilus]
MLALIGARIFDGARMLGGHALCLDGGRVADVVPQAMLPPDVPREALGGGILAPGFVDLQVNGGAGLMLGEAGGVDDLRRIAEAHARRGATAILPTLISDTPDATERAVALVAEAVRAGVPGIAGLHLEGPHLDPRKAGAHDPRHLRPMEADDLDRLQSAAAALPALMVTLAPEAATEAQVRALAGSGAVVALGHSGCDAATARRYVDAGARVVTHLFNAMAPMGHRAPGLAGAALSEGRLDAGVIADGHHVDPLMLGVAMRAKAGPGALFLVSDAMAPAGTEAARFELGGRAVRRAGGRLVLSDGTLAGADLDLARAVRVMTAAGAAPEGALAMATAIPARVAGLDAGAIAPGTAADLVHLDDGLNLQAVWRGGRRIAS